MNQIFTALVACFVMCSAAAFSQDNPSTDADESGAPDLLYLIYDSSNSMWGELSDKSRKYEAGRNAMAGVLRGNALDRELALRAYGHRDKTDCRDSELIVAAGSPAQNSMKISKAVAGIRPTGKTPITYSLRESLKDFDGRKGDILLISDGIETCDIDPCTLMDEWRDAGIQIRVHVVGVGLNEMERNAMSCVAETSGGKYFDVGSEGELQEALNEAVEIPAGAPDPNPQGVRYALRLQGVDKEGRSFVLGGKLFKGGEEVSEVSSSGRNSLEGPGDYALEVGPILKDGTLYKTVRQTFSVSEPGDTTVSVLITRPAIVSANFSEDGEEHRGSHVSAYQDGKKVFSFRAFDEALARPGVYEFRATPNDDNELRVTAELVEAAHTELDFILVKTVKTLVRYRLPNGDEIRRGGKLFKDGKEAYKLYSSNWSEVIPGRYEVRSEGAKLALPHGVFIDVATDEETIFVDMPAGFLTITYDGDEADFFGKPKAAFYFPFDQKRGEFYASNYGRADVVIPITPNRYQIKGHSGNGFFEPVEINVPLGESITVTLRPTKLGKAVVSYAPSSLYTKQPDRAFIYPLDGQGIKNGFMRPGIAKKFLPGRYSVKGSTKGTSVAPQEFVITAGETTQILLAPISE